jgi:hypothetical protein
VWTYVLFKLFEYLQVATALVIAYPILVNRHMDEPIFSIPKTIADMYSKCEGDFQLTMFRKQLVASMPTLALISTRATSTAEPRICAGHHPKTYPGSRTVKIMASRGS